MAKIKIARRCRDVLAALALVLSVPAQAANAEFVTLASTTSTQNSGLFDYLLPKFKAATGIGVRVVAVGTGAALNIARNGDADLLLVHHKASETKFVEDGYGLKRHVVMFNDYVIVGDRADPAGVAKASSAPAALEAIARARTPFVSRGDDSGTHKRERELWRHSAFPQPAGDWYREIGAGMGATLNMTAALGAYSLSDRGTWLSFKNRGNLTVLYQGDATLRNVYGLIQVSPRRHPHVKAAAAQKFVAWMMSEAGQTAIGEFRVNGKKLFHPASSN